MAQRILTFIFIITIAVVYSCSSAQASGKFNVYVSILPQRYFVEAIGKDLVSTTVIADPRQSPADYEPSPAQMTGMTKADIYFAVGVAFENSWLKKFSEINPGMKIVHTDAGIEKKPIDRYEMHQSHKSHHHGASDPHIWLSPPLVKIQAEHILNGLVLIDPANRNEYQKNYALFLTRIARLDEELKTLFSAQIPRKKFLVFHPSWGYFADAYGLTQISIEIEGKSPKARELTNLIEFARQQDIRLIFVQPQFSVKQAEIIANEINGRLIYADPLAEDWVHNLQTVAISIKQALN